MSNVTNQQQNFFIKRNDTLPALKIQIKTRGTMGETISYSLSAATAVTMTMKESCGTLRVASSAAQIINSCEGIIQYNWNSRDTALAGKYLAEFEVIFSGGTKQTVPLVGQLYVVVLEDLNNK